MESQEKVGLLVDEYRTLLEGLDVDEAELLEDVLIREADWTPRAAEHLVQLSKRYGSFMLRNALAFSLALGIEDGDLGF
jgi:hypothetical protein